MSKPYKFEIEDCDVENKKSLEYFRARRAAWLSWLDEDEHHAIVQTIAGMVWDDVAFRVIAKAGEIEAGRGTLSNSLVVQVLIEGYFSKQIMAARRLTDSHRDTYSLRLLLDDFAKNDHVFTRENFVCFDGYPYDYDKARERFSAAHIGSGAFWVPNEGPDAFGRSEDLHRLFDKLACTAPDKRKRSDRIPRERFETLQAWIKNCDATDIKTWADNVVAHAASAKERQKIDMAAIAPSMDKITSTIGCFVRVSEASHSLLGTGHGNAMPVAQFNPIENLGQNLSEEQRKDLNDLWKRLTDERDKLTDGVIEEWIGAPAPAEGTKSIFDFLKKSDWLADPEGMAALEAGLCLEEFAVKKDQRS